MNKIYFYKYFRHNIKYLPVFLFLISIISGCASTQLAVTAIKHVSKKSDNNGQQISKNNVPIGPGGIYKVGNPYIINNVKYIPSIQPNYNKTGIASWYGMKFHGKKTANGEIYDMNELTAAHKTLPMPSYVQVINIDNGRSLVVRVNDRGPFVNNRIIDMSRRGAQLLGFKDQGIAKVRVKLVSPSEEGFIAKKPLLKDEIEDKVIAVPLRKVESEPIEITDTKNKPAASTNLSPQIALEPVEVSRVYIQVGSFSIYQNASKLGARLSPYGPIQISSLIIKEVEFFRVRIGPLSTVKIADETLIEIINIGHNDARIIID